MIWLLFIFPSINNKGLYNNIRDKFIGITFCYILVAEEKVSKKKHFKQRFMQDDLKFPYAFQVF